MEWRRTGSASEQLYYSTYRPGRRSALFAYLTAFLFVSLFLPSVAQANPRHAQVHFNYFSLTLEQVINIPIDGSAHNYELLPHSHRIEGKVLRHMSQQLRFNNLRRKKSTRDQPPRQSYVFDRRRPVESSKSDVKLGIDGHFIANLESLNQISGYIRFYGSKLRRADIYVGEADASRFGGRSPLIVNLLTQDSQLGARPQRRMRPEGSNE